MKYTSKLILFVLVTGWLTPVFSQTDTTVIAGKQYGKSSFHQWLWGKHYRKDWTTPVRVPIIMLDTVNGGLKPYQEGGGRQSKTLRLRNGADKEYVLRSIDKTFGKALPDLYRGTFIERIMDDQVSIAEPYASLTIPSMAEAAKIHHTNPVIAFIPQQAALGKYNEEYGNSLYLLEQRPDENWEEADNFGNAKKIVGTEKMLENIWEDNDNRVDQLAFVKARMFDMFIGDWSRHEDQWRWGEFENGDEKTYVPIPRDRDQAYTKLDGVLLSLGKSVAGAGHLQGFGPDIKKIGLYNFPARNLDRRVANEVTKEQWIAAAKELKQQLTDEVIENAIRKLPPEVFSNEGPVMISHLKSRRDKLESFASDYYDILAREVEIPGTHKEEFFEITRNGNDLAVHIYDLNKEGEPKKKPFYSRVFHENETDEIRIYGLSGADRYQVSQENNSPIRIRLIGGPDADAYQFSGSNHNVHIYDSKSGNELKNTTGVHTHLSSNPFIHYYQYDGFNYDDRGLGPVISYNSEDHIHVGLKYSIENQQWRKFPFGSRQELSAKYSINEQAFSFGYEGIFNQVIGRWNFLLNGDYDQVRWHNFFGIGNETVMGTDDRDYHRVRTTEWHASAGLQRLFAHYNDLRITGIFQSIEILDDHGRFLSEQLPKLQIPAVKKFAGAQLTYQFKKLDDLVVPRKGLLIKTTGRFLQNLDNGDSSALSYGGEVNFYIPLSKSFGFYFKSGANSVTGHPEFYQLSRLGGVWTLRGVRRNRFHGKTAFYNQAELQFIKDIRTSLMNGKAGLIALYDVGRVWQPGENSNTWHNAIGGGVMLAPFNKFSVAAFYAFSKEERDISVRFIRDL